MGKDNYLLDKKFGFDAKRYNNLKQPLLAYGFDDDTLVPKASFEKILSAYSSASIENRFIETKNTPVGHLGFFRPSAKDTFWLDTLAWINMVNEERSNPV
jgi:predicted alpha/beta hydrolase